MKMTIFCKHYLAMSDHTKCEAGIAYDTLEGHGSPRYFDKCPCFWRRGHGAPQPTSCLKAAYPTDEEIAADEAESRRMMENIGKARVAIVTHLGGPWKRGAPGGSGRIDCPVCGGKQTLRFSRAGCNGHVHAGCTTPDCVRWME